jgi:hypothetical protein
MKRSFSIDGGQGEDLGGDHVAALPNLTWLCLTREKLNVKHKKNQ